jgi:3',5'-cyclic AMP phosphodiesterase CpdA
MRSSYGRALAAFTQASLVAICLIGCSMGVRPASEVTSRPSSSPSFTVMDRDLEPSPRFIVYGDMRFTDLSETKASSSGPRRLLVARIGREHPDAVFLTGDVPWHGGNRVDYEVFAQETAAWRSEQLRVFPVLGNHEFKGCREADCLAHWWQAFPQESGRRWYSVALGSQLQLIALDSDSSLLPTSEQAKWLEGQLDDLPAGVRFVLFLLHHPPVTDASDGVRSNESAFAEQLAVVAPTSRARFIVCAAHIHNYERFQRDNILFLVSGGGGGKPEAVKRSAADLYQSDDFPNFHYLRFQLTARQLRGEMVRLDADAAAGPSWSVRDRFAVDPKTP